MITSSDREYTITKLIKQGKATIPDEFRLLAQWIDQTYHVKTLNIIFDTIEPDRRPRLNVIFEFVEEAMQFNTPNQRVNYDEEKQQAIARRFNEIHSGDQQKNLLVIFSSFRPLAREEANGKIGKTALESLKAEIGNKDLWTISNQFAAATFFFYTDEQVKHYASIGTEPIYSDKYFRLLKQYDEFGYFSRDEFSIALDSKENFDKNFSSNWYYYYH